MAALSILVLMTSVAAGLGFILQASLSYSRRSMAREELRFTLEREAERVIQAFSADPTPEADSLLDPVWAAVQAPEAEGVKIVPSATRSSPATSAVAFRTRTSTARRMRSANPTTRPRRGA